MHKLKKLVDSDFGTVHQCECCKQFHLTIGNVSIRLGSNLMIALNELIEKALKVDRNEEISSSNYSKFN